MAGRAGIVEVDQSQLDMRIDGLFQAVQTAATFAGELAAECRRTAAAAAELLELVEGMKVVLVAKAA